MQGIATYNNQIEIPAGHELHCTAGRYRLPNYAAANRPSNAYVGELIINTDTATLEMWTGDRWANCGGGNRGGYGVDSFGFQVDFESGFTNGFRNGFWSGFRVDF